MKKNKTIILLCEENDMRHSTTMMMTVQLLFGLKNRMSKLHRKIKFGLVLLFFVCKI